MFLIVEDPINTERLLESVKDNSAGATVLFLGTVRDHNKENKVSGIYYEAYISMAERAIAVSAEHRDVAFRAAEFAIAKIKTEIPVWKKEKVSGNQGDSFWVEGVPL